MTPRRAATLLDVNVLVALAWPNHVGHRAARAWFATHAERGWATTPVTETGFARVSCNRRALPTATTAAIAADLLGQLRAARGHRFWADDVEGVGGGHVDLERLSGHRQVTDAHLLAVCASYDGRLATFDRGLRTLATDQSMVELVEV
ncbi:MAG: TA system VapC family ribonuclease toxin [Nocardioides sp.]